MKTEPAFAKINLALHVTGQRTDGYHLLDSLVAFAAVGDVIRVETADGLSLQITGPMAADLPVTDDNLVLRAARAFRATRGAAITLEKHLPVASGIGGGSADAAATLRALSAFWGLPLPAPDVVLALGADVPACLCGVPLRMSGIGDCIAPLGTLLPPAWVVLVNPGIALPTPQVFRGLVRKDNPALPQPLPRWPDAAALARFLAGQRNDLEPPARAIAPVIGDVIAALAASDGCLLSRMSGSGATCFGLYATAPAARAAAAGLRRQGPAWWVAAAVLLRGPDQPDTAAMA